MRILVAGKTYKRIMPRCVRKLYLKCLFIHIYFHTLVGKLLEQLHKAACAQTESSFALAARYLKTRSEGVLPGRSL